MLELIPQLLIYLVASGLLGLVFGSFAGVLIQRIPKGQNVLNGRSHCHYCRHKLTPLELIPLISWLLQFGRTRCCRRPLPLFYPLIELAISLGFIFITWFFSESPRLIIPWWGVWFSTVTLAAIDYSEYILPDALILSFGFFAFLTQLISKDLSGSQLIAGIIAGLFFWCLWYFSRGRALGFGDVKLVLAMSLGLTWLQLIISLYTAFLTGAIVGVILIMTKIKSLKSPVPFGPFLLIGYLVAAFFSDQILVIFQNIL